MPSGYEGVTVKMTVSSALPGESQRRDMSVDDANAVIRALIHKRLERRFPGANIQVETGGDRPQAEIQGMTELRLVQQAKYDAEKTALAVKWDFSPFGLGLPPE